MARTRTYYNHQGVSIGPSPNTGQHFMTQYGQMVDDDQQPPGVFNLVMPLTRVQSFSFSFDDTKENLLQLGSSPTIKRPILEYPVIPVDINWLNNGLINEARIGLDVNYPRFEYPLSGTSYYGDNYEIFLLNGISSRNLGRPTGEPFWPHSGYKDKRNLFLSISPQENDLNDSEINETITSAFGNCYLTSYSNSASVGSFPSASCSFICENLNFHSSGSGLLIPAISAKTRLQSFPFHFNIPANEVEEQLDIGVLRPGDIKIEISSSDDPSLGNLFASIDDSCFESYAFNIPIEREGLNSIGFKMPLDRVINFPIFSNLSFDINLRDFSAGSLLDQIKENHKYDVTIIMKSPPCHQNNAYAMVGRDFQRYDFKNAELASLEYEAQIEDRASLSFSFEIEMDPNNLSKGIFISGHLNVLKTQDFLTDESGNYIVDDDGNRIVTNLVPIY